LIILHNNWLRGAAVLIFLYLAGEYLVPALLPFLFALSFALLLEPGIAWCCRRFGFQRKFAASALTTLCLAALFALAWVFLAKLVGEAMALWERIPSMLEGLPTLVEQLTVRYEVFCRACPEEIRLWLNDTVRALAGQGVSVLGELSSRILALVSSWMGMLPRLVLFLFTAVLAAYFTTLTYPEILAFFKKQMPPQWRQHWAGAPQCLRSTFWKWMKAQSFLCFLTFALLGLGFWYMGVEYALFLAVVTALIDALPVLGAGVILVPWGVGSLVLGNVPRGVAVLVLYAILLIGRSILEPKLMAAQVGLPPLTALAAMYTGFVLFGIGGMLLFPVVLLFFKQLQDGGYVRFWK